MWHTEAVSKSTNQPWFMNAVELAYSYTFEAGFSVSDWTSEWQTEHISDLIDAVRLTDSFLSLCFREYWVVNWICPCSELAVWTAGRALSPLTHLHLPGRSPSIIDSG